MSGRSIRFATVGDGQRVAYAVSGDVVCAGKKLQFSHHSDATLKGFADPVALYEVGS